MGKRYIKLYEQITEWEWYQDINTFRLFVHLLLKANYKDIDFRGRIIRRGQLVTSLTKLAANTSLTIRQVRDSLNHLVMTGEVTNESTSQYRIITVVKYDDYQSSDKRNDNQVTNEVTNKGQTNDKQNDKQNDNKYRNTIETVEGVEKKKTPSVFVPPTLDEVRAYCQERNKGVDPEKWFDWYSAKGFMVGKNKMKDWRAAVRTWEKDRDSSPAPKQDARDVHGYEQRSYENEQQTAMARMMSDDWGLS